MTALPVPTRRLAGTAAVVALVVLAAPGSPWVALGIADGVLVVVAMVDWCLAPPLRRLTVTRELPEVVTLGQHATVAWRVRNPLRRRLRLGLADELMPSLRPGRRRVWLRLPAGGQATARTRITPGRRGRFPASQITVRVLGPLGLVARQGVIEAAGILRVYPPFRSRAEAELRLRRARIQQAGLRTAQERGGGTDFDSLREYTSDDESRRIDWAATARAGKTIVRTYRAERNQRVVVLLDTGRTMAARVAADEPVDQASGVEDLPRLDHGIDAAMALTAVATGLGDLAGLVAFADGVRAVVPPGHRRDQLRRVTDACYTLEAELVESDYQLAFTETLTRFRRRALLIVVTELASHAVEETLLPALPLVLRDHLVVVGAVRDPRLDEWAAALPGDAAAVYRKAAAVQALEGRRRTVAQLRGLGALVVDSRPGRLGPDLVDAYLGVKSAGRL